MIHKKMETPPDATV